MEQVCRELDVSRSGYYEWLKRKPSVWKQHNQELWRALAELHEKYPALGLDSLHHLLNPRFHCSRKRVHRLMRAAGILSLRYKSRHERQTRPSHRPESALAQLFL